jgi:hypothetical protein
MTLMINRADLAAAAEHFAEAARLSRAHVAAVQAAIRRYGEGNGQLISGVARDHFPDRVKNRLRALARGVSVQNDAGIACRPARVRFNTMHELARAICRRDGTGFYGYMI